jgi:2,5-diketo-D-gluconate reductase A
VIPTRTLISGQEIPLLGLGTYPMDGAAGAAVMAEAISLGYRLLDTAAKYSNEWAVGEAIRRSGVDRVELFITSKLRGADHGRAKTRDAVSASLDRLGLDYLDLYLIHWPLPKARAVHRVLRDHAGPGEGGADPLGRGVEFQAVAHRGADRCDRRGPAVDQMELSPALPRRDTVAHLAATGVLPQAWSPLGGSHGVLGSAPVTAIARHRGITPAQVVLRWAVQQGIAVIPKSASAERQRANLDIFGFTLTDAEMAGLAGVDLGEEAAVDSDLPEE